MQELTIHELDNISGGIGPILTAMLFTAGYIGALQVAADFGAGLRAGLYDATH